MPAVGNSGNITSKKKELSRVEKEIGVTGSDSEDSTRQCRRIMTGCNLIVICKQPL